MRLTDRCQITRDGSPLPPDSWPCEFGHTGGDTPFLPGHTRYKETARVIVGPSPELAAINNIAGLEVIHKEKTYKVTAVLPRYRPGGRLHHLSLDLEVIYG